MMMMMLFKERSTILPVVVSDTMILEVSRGKSSPVDDEYNFVDVGIRFVEATV